jgi:hypothetical protein
MSISNKLIQAASGNAGSDNLYVEDVFSTYLYTGTGSALTITNGIDLDGEGGLVWIKNRDTVDNNVMFSPTFGPSKMQRIKTDAQETVGTDVFQSFNSDGFTHGGWGGVGGNGNDIASWTFRKAEKFFDVVTYTSNGQSGQTISHSLGSVPGMILVKRTDGTSDWISYNSTGSAYKQMVMNTTAANNSDKNFDQIATDSTLKVGHIGGTTGVGEINGQTCVAYLFASDAGGFGDDGSENIIKCGSYTGNGNVTGPLINLGFEPQFVLIKAASRTGHWFLLDVLRGIPTGPSSSSPGTNQYLLANSSGAEGATTSINVNSTGFQPRTTDDSVNENAATYIYIAIRRPMKTPTAGTEVFALEDPGYPLGSNGLAYTSGFPVDLALLKERTNSSDGWYTMSRMQGSGRYMKTNLTNAEASGVSNGTFDHNTGWYKATNASMSWMFKRAPGFMDVVAWTGNNNTNQRVSHNLSVVPELIIYKGRNKVNYWRVYSGNINQYIALNINNPIVTGSNLWGSSAPTTTDFGINCGSMDLDSFNAVAYLFATVAGVSKVGSYTGTGSNVDVDCGFSAGARFVLIKRTDDTGNWFVYDSVRGIVAGADPYLLLNSTAAEASSNDDIDPLSSGFSIPSGSNVNASGGTYIFLAIA